MSLRDVINDEGAKISVEENECLNGEKVLTCLVGGQPLAVNRDQAELLSVILSNWVRHLNADGLIIHADEKM